MKPNSPCLNEHFTLEIKNIAFSLASRHQRLLCYELSADKLLYSPTENGPCQKQALLRFETQDVQRSLSLLPGISEDTSVCHLFWIKQDRITVKRSCCYVIIAVNELDSTFARIEDILYIMGEVILLVQHYSMRMQFRFHRTGHLFV